jgi:hypothetical protein
MAQAQVQAQAAFQAALARFGFSQIAIQAIVANGITSTQDSLILKARY